MKLFPTWHQVFLAENPSRLQSIYYGFYYFLRWIPRLIFINFLVPLVISLTVMPLRGLREMFGFLIAGFVGHLRVADITLEERSQLEHDRMKLVELEKQYGNLKTQTETAPAAEQTASGP